jgi:hypothetical protein
MEKLYTKSEVEGLMKDVISMANRNGAITDHQAYLTEEFIESCLPEEEIAIDCKNERKSFVYGIEGRMATIYQVWDDMPHVLFTTYLQKLIDVREQVLLNLRDEGHIVPSDRDGINFTLVMV